MSKKRDNLPLLVSFIRSRQQESPCKRPHGSKKREGWRHSVPAGSGGAGETPGEGRGKKAKAPGPAKEEEEAQEAAKNEASNLELNGRRPETSQGFTAQVSSAHLACRSPCPQALSPPLFYMVYRKNMENVKERKEKKKGGLPWWRSG